MNRKILTMTVCLACAAIFVGSECLAQIQTGVWRTPSNNTDYHHFTRNGGGAAVYINQESTAANHPILRLSSGSAGANANVRFTVENNGKVGIGTMVPSAKLEVRSSGTIGGKWEPSNSFLTVSDGSGTLLLDPNEIYASGTVHFGARSGDIVKFRTVSDTGIDDKVVIKANGNVGIGTMTPAEKLSVNGNIRAHEIKLETGNWPDYVFGENYRQLSLEEVEAFIKANGHLPGLKSAKEYQEEGVEMMALNQKLLEKIEELTLNAIAHEKKMDGQTKEINTLKSEMEELKQLIREKL